MDDLYERIKVIIVDQLGVDEDKVTPDARFREDLASMRTVVAHRAAP